MITIEVMTKKDCCLCDDAKEIIEQVIADFPAQLKMTDIESDPELLERYKEKIPVVLINDKESFVYKVHPITLRKKLEQTLSSNDFPATNNPD
jgi:glutaredoxin